MTETLTKKLVYDNGGLCSACDPWCIHCMTTELNGPWRHNPDTQECPTSKYEADKFERENYRRHHHGFNKNEFSINTWRVSECKNPCHTKYWIYKNPYAEGVEKIEIKSMCHSCSNCPRDSKMQVTHLDTGIMYEATIKYYNETLNELLGKLRGRLDGIQDELERKGKK